MLGLPTLYLLLLVIGPDAGLDLAEQLHRTGQYEAAAAVYDFLGRDRICSGQFYSAKGNAHFLAGHIPHAILAYHQALRKLPGDTALLENVADARSRVLDSPGYETLGGHRSRAAGAIWIAAYLTYVFGWIVLGMWLSSPQSRSWRRAATLLLVSAFLAVVPLLPGFADDPRPFAVVAEDGVMLRRGNGLSYEPVEHAGQLVRLNRGVEARVRATRPNGWVQLELANGVIGWAPPGQLLVEQTIGP